MSDAADQQGMKTFSDLKTIAPMPVRERTTLEPGTLFAERYEVLREIGAGGMGVVYLATDRHTAEQLALKLIHPDLLNGEDAVKKLIAEGLTARQIRHPKIVAVYDVAQDRGQPYFTMEFVGGGSLRSWMINHVASRQDVPLTTAVGLIKSMLAGIAEAHRKGIVHRDLKPENVLLTGDPEQGDFDLKILDFGIAKAVKAPRTTSSRPVGTAPYMAPEQVTSAEAVGPAADIYSLSVMFYELLMEAAPQARWEPVSKNRPGVPKAIDDLIEKGLSARSRSRHASVLEFEKALDEALKPPAPLLDNWKEWLDQPTPQPPPPLPPVHNIDPRPEPPLPQPQPKPPTPEPQPIPGPRPGVWASLSPKARKTVYALVALVVIAIAALMDGKGGGSGPVTAEERWRDEAGNLYTVQRKGANFDGFADNVNVNGVNYGSVDISGVVQPSGGNIVIENDRGTIYQSNGATVPGTAPGTIDAVFGNTRFHINH